MKANLTLLFEKFLANKDIRTYKKSIIYYLLFRIFRNFLNGFIVVNINNFKIYVSASKKKASYAILKKCDFSGKW